MMRTAIPVPLMQGLITDLPQADKYYEGYRYKFNAMRPGINLAEIYFMVYERKWYIRVFESSFIMWTSDFLAIADKLPPIAQMSYGHIYRVAILPPVIKRVPAGEWMLPTEIDETIIEFEASTFQDEPCWKLIISK